jgi:hypothetical protein
MVPCPAEISQSISQAHGGALETSPQNIESRQLGRKWLSLALFGFVHGEGLRPPISLLLRVYRACRRLPGLIQRKWLKARGKRVCGEW